MSKPLDELYLTWLYSQIGSVSNRNKERTYWDLTRALFHKEFVWLVPNDHNRVEDGRELRFEFMEASDMDEVDPDWLDMGCSVLEMLIALSRRLAFEAGGHPREWFFELLENLGLFSYNDNSHFDPEEVDEVIDNLIWRTYAYDGRGGLFPLNEPHKDQRDEEIWYQMSAYILERT